MNHFGLRATNSLHLLGCKWDGRGGWTGMSEWCTGRGGGEGRRGDLGGGGWGGGAEEVSPPPSSFSMLPNGPQRP